MNESIPLPAEAKPALSARERFVRAARCQPVDRPPVWLMRQAGRALPEYRKLKETHTFVQLVQTPDLAVEVTLQPVRRFGFDAAILFSDILVIPEAMGQTYHFRETGGVVMDFAVKTAADIQRLSVSEVCEKLAYVDTALRQLRRLRRADLFHVLLLRHAAPYVDGSLVARRPGNSAVERQPGPGRGMEPGLRGAHRAQRRGAGGHVEPLRPRQSEEAGGLRLPLRS